ncbi:MAG: ATP synthase F1 subunit delta [Alphaproteobacteria bacterium]|nr:ATP synthase F1 subunit delta [Alphaproteobacteria bacterium]
MKNVSDLKTAILYAQAMYDGAEEANQLSALYSDAEVLNSIICEKREELGKLNNPLWKYSQKEEVLTDISRKLGLSQSMLNTLKLLAQNGKLNVLEQTLRQFILLYQNKHNIAEIEITTVIPLTSSQENLLKSKLENIFHKQVILRYIINPQIIGGLVIKYGTNFIDNSIKHKLRALEQLMKGTK